MCSIFSAPLCGWSCGFRFLLKDIRDEGHRDHKLRMMARMQEYLNSTMCRRKYVLARCDDRMGRSLVDPPMPQIKETLCIYMYVYVCDTSAPCAAVAPALR